VTQPFRLPSRLCRRACLFGVALWLFSVPVAARAAEDGALCAQGKAALEAGQHDKAIGYFKAARTAEPGNADAWYQEGIAHAYQKEFDLALPLIEKATALAPKDMDKRLGLARVLSWKHDYKEADAVVAKVLAEAPEHEEALLLAARLSFYEGREDEAMKGYARVLKKNPASSDAKEGMAQIERAQKEAEGYRWQVDLGHGTSRFSRQEQENWRDETVQLNYKFDDKTQIYGRYNLVRRFGSYNRFYEGGVNHRFTPGITTYAALAGSPEGDFLPEHRVRAGGTARVIHQHPFLGDTFLTIDGIFDAYRDGEIKTVNPGLEYHVNDQFWVTLRHINVFDADNEHLKGWFARADWQALPQIRFNIGTSDAPETVAGIPVDTRSYFGGLAWNITDQATFYLGYSHDDREASYINKTVSSGLSLKF
jgi:YaiO family outer membrane protein